MLNQTLKNDVAPWQKQGKWYHAFIESGDSVVLTVCDIPNATVSGATFVMPADFHYIDYVITDIDLVASKSIAKTYKTNSAGKEYISIPNSSDYTYCDMWVYGYFKES